MVQPVRAIEVEVCVEGAPGVAAAARAGAARAELCAALGEGGTSASHGALVRARRVSGIALTALVRPRAGDFLYSDEELAVMAEDVEAARALGLAGVALGCLTAEGAVDEERTAALCARARPLELTFHRAFDHARDPGEALEALVRLGFARVLSSGGAESAWKGRAELARLVRQAAGRLTIVAAGGVRAEHARALVEASGVRALHLSASTRRESAMRHRTPHPSLGAARASESYAHWDTDEARVRALFDALG